jgi:hypothetical protein
MALGLGLGLTFTLVGCGGRRGSAPPAQAPPSNPAPTARPAAGEAELRRQLSGALQAADDQFNRGENDLACGQVQRAQRLLETRPERATAGQREQLLRFQRACSTL